MPPASPSAVLSSAPPFAILRPSFLFTALLHLLLPPSPLSLALAAPQPPPQGLPNFWGRSIEEGRLSDVQVRLGENRFVRGVEVEFSDKHLSPVTAYLGIRYGALDTLGGQPKRRFQPPIAPFLFEEVSGVQRKTELPNVCPQNIPDLEEYEKTHQPAYVNYLKRIVPFLKKQSEECLNLNIYVPAKNDHTIHQLPVLLFVHGDSYEFGTGNAYDPTVFASYGQTIVITLNYRIGVFGFFASESGDAMGNYALLDLQAALQWIHSEISRFGGDRDNLTLMGHGHGAALVNLLMASNLVEAKDSFKIRRVILLSGSATAPWATSKFFHYFSNYLATALNCTRSELRDRLLRLSVDEILRLMKHAPDFRYASRMGPVVSNMFFPLTDSEHLYSRPGTAFKRADLLLGVTKSEALHLLNQNGIDEANFRRSVRTFVRQNFVYHQQKIFDILVNFYTDWTKMASNNKLQITHAFMESLMNLLGDANYVAPAFQMARLHSLKGPGHRRGSQGNTFVFVFAHTSSIPDYPGWSSGFHGDDLMFIFGAPIVKNRIVSPFPSHFLITDKMLSEAMMRYISNFVKSGNPNFPLNHTSYFSGHIVNRLASTSWPKFEVSSVEALYIDQAPSLPKRLVRHYRSKELALWQHLLPSIHTSDNLPVSYHTLHGFHNVSLFEEESQFIDTGTKFSTPRLYALRPTPTTPSPTRFPPNHKSDFYEVVTASPSLGEGQDAAGTTVSSKNALIWTVTAGCALLVLNALVFCGIYYQTGRLRHRRRQNKRETGGALAGGGPAIGLTASANVASSALSARTLSSSHGSPGAGGGGGGVGGGGSHSSSNHRNHVNYRALGQNEPRVSNTYKAPPPPLTEVSNCGLMAGTMGKSYPSATWTLPRSYKEEVNGADGHPITMV